MRLLLSVMAQQFSISVLLCVIREACSHSPHLTNSVINAKLEIKVLKCSYSRAAVTESQYTYIQSSVRAVGSYL